MDARLAAAWGAGTRPRYTQGDRWIMPLGGGSYTVLADGSNLTRAGETLRNLGWNEPNLAMDMFQVPEIRGNTEYLRLRSGQRVVGREWKNGNWVYKARG